MTTISIVLENAGAIPRSYCAIAGNVQSTGKTAGEALDAVTAQLEDSDAGTILVIQNLRPDAFFSAEQQIQMRDLMERWRLARDGQGVFDAKDQTKLSLLVEEEIRAAGRRAETLLGVKNP